MGAIGFLSTGCVLSLEASVRQESTQPEQRREEHYGRRDAHLERRDDQVAVAAVMQEVEKGATEPVAVRSRLVAAGGKPEPDESARDHTGDHTGDVELDVVLALESQQAAYKDHEVHDVARFRCRCADRNLQRGITIIHYY